MSRMWVVWSPSWSWMVGILILASCQIPNGVAFWTALPSPVLRTKSVGPGLWDSASSVELENEEPLSVIFQRAVVLQRAGSYPAALEEYDLFLKAARQCSVDPIRYAEVHVNRGAIFLRQGKTASAQEEFEAALEHRPTMGTALVNLAVLALQQASQSQSPQVGLECLETAQFYCQKVLDAASSSSSLPSQDQDPQSVATATRLLKDIQQMMDQSNRR